MRKFFKSKEIKEGLEVLREFASLIKDGTIKLEKNVYTGNVEVYVNSKKFDEYAKKHQDSIVVKDIKGALNRYENSI